MLAVNLGFALRATPGNVGVFQVLYALTAAAFGMDKDQAIAVAFLIQAQQIIPVTLLGVALAPEFIFKRKKVTRGEDDGCTGDRARSPRRPERSADVALVRAGAGRPSREVPLHFGLLVAALMVDVAFEAVFPLSLKFLIDDAILPRRMRRAR